MVRSYLQIIKKTGAITLNNDNNSHVQLILHGLQCFSCDLDCNTPTSVSKRFLPCTIKIMSFCAVIRVIRQHDNINAVPCASSMPEVVSISKWWKSNLESSCSKTAFLSQSQPVNLQTIFYESLVRICRIQSWMYFCCQWEGCLHWPQDCMISFATRSVTKWKWRLPRNKNPARRYI